MTGSIGRERARGVLLLCQETDLQELQAQLDDPNADHAAAQRFFELRQAILACMVAAVDQTPEPEECVENAVLLSATISGIFLRIASDPGMPSPDAFFDATTPFVQTVSHASGMPAFVGRSIGEDADDDAPAVRH